MRNGKQWHKHHRITSTVTNWETIAKRDERKWLKTRTRESEKRDREIKEVEKSTHARHESNKFSSGFFIVVSFPFFYHRPHHYIHFGVLSHANAFSSCSHILSLSHTTLCFWNFAVCSKAQIKHPSILVVIRTVSSGGNDDDDRA